MAYKILKATDYRRMMAFSKFFMDNIILEYIWVRNEKLLLKELNDGSVFKSPKKQRNFCKDFDMILSVKNLEKAIIRL